MLLSIDGMDSTAARLKLVPAPVFPELKVPSATTVTASSSLETSITASSSYGSPSLRTISAYPAGDIPI